GAPVRAEVLGGRDFAGARAPEHDLLVADGAAERLGVDLVGRGCDVPGVLGKHGRALEGVDRRIHDVYNAFKPDCASSSESAGITAIPNRHFRANVYRSCPMPARTKA